MSVLGNFRIWVISEKKQSLMKTRLTVLLRMLVGATMNCQMAKKSKVKRLPLKL
ncbi:hypothetical protein D3C87_1804490 [compost metagenome]